ncbi:MAG TPA: hypothetical protein PLA94_02280 [Myxococcota bacterium]|nr:hypothetical protein [Myxococcota bacterium]
MARKSVESLLTPYAQQLGKVPDQDIADKAGVSRAVTVAYRKKLGIPPYDGHRHRGKDAAAPAPVEEPKAAPKAEKVKAPKAEPKAEPVVKAEEKAPAEASFRGRKSALDQYVHLLGTRPDAEIAAMANVTPENVRTYRTRRGIPSTWRQADAAPAPAPAPAAKAPKAAKAAKVAAVPAPAPTPAPTVEPVVIVPVVEVAPVIVPVVEPAPVVPVELPAPLPPVAAGALVAFQVILESEGTTLRYVVVGTDIAAAAGTTLAGLARRHPGFDVRSIERIADVLA